MTPTRCIIIEDDPAFQVILKSLINKLSNFEILDVFDNSVDAALFITRKKPDIVFLDVEINGLNGLEVLDSLETKPKTIVISGDPSYEEEAKELGVDAFIAKPIANFESFQKVVQGVI